MADYVVIPIEDEDFYPPIEIKPPPVGVLPQPPQELPAAPAGAAVRLMRKTVYSHAVSPLELLPAQNTPQLITKITCKIDTPFYDDAAATLQIMTSAGQIIAGAEDFLTQSEYEIDFDENVQLPANTSVLLVISTTGQVGGGVIYVDYHKGV